MPLAHVYEHPVLQTLPRHRAVLVTGAAGDIGRSFAQLAGDRYALRLMVRPGDEDIDELQSLGEVIKADVTNLDAMKRACAGIDTVLHLAADPSPNATWDVIRDVNIAGTYQVAVAARAAGCRRFIYASSIHAVSGHPVGRQVHTDDPVNPGTLYGVSKCFAEALCRYLAEQEGISCIAVRIGAFQPIEAAQHPDSIEMLDAWVSPRDLQDLLQRCIDADHLRFAVVHGLSGNRFNRMDITATQELLGYAPKDDFTRTNDALRGLELADEVVGHNLKDGKPSGLREEL